MSNETRNVSANASLETANVNLSFVQKLPFTSGYIAYGLVWTVIMGYLTIFWTDVALLPAGVVSAFLLITKLWDAINDPMIGALADRTQTRFGRYRPWLLAFPITAICGLCTFTVIPGASTTVQAVFSLVSYFLYVIFYTMGEVPGMGLLAATTTNEKCRASIANFRMIGSYLVSIVVSYIFLGLVNDWGQGNVADGYFRVVLVFTIISIPLALYYFFGVKERVTIPVKRYSMKQNIACLKGNTPFWLFVAAFFAYGISSGTTSARVFFWTYNYGDAAVMSISMSVWMVGQLTGSILNNFFMKVAKNKAHVVTLGWGFGGICALICGLFPITTGSLTVFHVITYFYGVGLGVGTSAMYGVLPDITEYTQWKYKMRVSGFVSSILNCAYKWSLALGAAALTFIMGLMGYVPNVAQPNSMLVLFNTMSHFIPAAVMVLAGVIMLAYKIDSKTFAQIRAELAARTDDE